MAQWAVIISTERYEAERLFHHDTLELTGSEARPAPGDEVLVVVGGESPAVVAVGRFAGVEDCTDPDDPASANGPTGPLVIAYTRRSFDDPQPADELTLGGPLTQLDPVTFRRYADRVQPPPANKAWLVSVDLPIEAGTPAEAVRRFWSYVMELGPRELPAFVSPTGNELAMTAYVMGEETSLDPEED